MPLSFRLHPGPFAVCRLPLDAPPPLPNESNPLFSLTRTPTELSLVCHADDVPPNTPHQSGWAALELIGPFPFHLTGILASVLNPLAAAQVPIFALSTFDTDWVLIPQAQTDAALRALAEAGHNRI